jgi:chromate transporter
VSPLATIALRFTILSLVAIGGVTSVLPEVHRVAVEVHHWVSDAEFTQMFVIARAAPGPNMLLVTLIGWQVAGLPGALVATAAMCVPSCTLSYFRAGPLHTDQSSLAVPGRRPPGAARPGLALPPPFFVG